MLKKRKLIEDTLIMVDRLKIEVNEDILRILRRSLSENSDSGEADPACIELPVSGDQVNRLVNTLFDVEAEYAPKSIGLGSEEDERRGKEAGNIAKIINEWNIDSKR